MIARLLPIAVCVTGIPSPEAAPARPNVVLILADDLGWSDLGCYGGEIPTPHLDRLAAAGMRFTQFYNNAKCTTTRASLITGVYPRAEGGDPWRQLLRPGMVTLGEALGAAGYRTALVGKWHLGSDDATHPRHRGFDEFYGLLDGCCNFFDPSRPDPPFKGDRVREFADNFDRVEEFPDGFYTTDAFTDRAIDWVAKGAAAEPDRPFFLHLCYTAPHYPLHAFPEDIARHRGKYLAGWDELRRSRFARQQAMGLLPPDCRLTQTDSRSYDWDSADQDREDLRMAVYAAMVERMDTNIGRLLAELDRLGLAESTLVVFLSDNGGCAEEPGGRYPETPAGPVDSYAAVGPAWASAQNTPFRRYKVWMHEGGVATPCVARWPGVVAPGTIAREVGHVIDFMPTLIELAGAAYPAEHEGVPTPPMDGVSLLPVLAGGRIVPRRLAWNFMGNSAIRDDDWKLVWDRLDPGWKLFNLRDDRTETNNLATQLPARVRELKQKYERWAAATGNESRRAGRLTDPVPHDAPNASAEPVD